jgi:nucleoside-diphosphate-sugar epimerase
MDSALVIGGTRFLGRAVVEALREEAAVTILTRGEHDNPFADTGVDRIEGDRTNDSALERAGEAVDPSVVVDCVAYYPRDVRAATRIFEGVDAYVYVSSGDAYGAEVVPKRESETALEPCSDERATDDGDESYGPRKAEGDRAVFAAADRGVRAMSVRPPVIYGPHDYTGRLGYWIDRVREHDRVVVPYTELRQLAFVEDVAAGIRAVAESGRAGRAYNVGDRVVPTLPEWVGILADVAGTDVEIVRAGPRELAAGGLAPREFPLYRDYPHLLDTHRLASLGWTATPVREAAASTVRAHDPGHGRGEGPDRADERRVLEVLGTVG